MEEALQRARYNETVHLTIQPQPDTATTSTDPPELPQSIALVPCLNEETGGVQFSDLLLDTGKQSSSLPPSSANDNVSDAAQAVSDNETVVLARRELQTKQWFFPMLNDTRRNELYDRAIAVAAKRIVERKRRRQRTRHTPVEASVTATATSAAASGERETSVTTTTAIRVLDIGSGTGLLAMLAARRLEQALSGSDKCGNDEKIGIEVTSLEMSEPLATVARQTIHDNGFQTTISVLPVHSTAHELATNVHNTAAPDPASGYDLCVSELLDDGLLGEGWLPALRDAWERRLLTSDAIVIPTAARVYVKLVQAEWLGQYTGARPYTYTCSRGNNNNTKSTLSFNIEDATGAETGLFAARQVVLPVHAEKLVRDGALRILSEPCRVWDVSVARPADIPSPHGRHQTTRVAVRDDGVVHGALVWWDLELYEGIVYSTRPDRNGDAWQDHWRPCLHVFTDSMEVKTGQSVALDVSHNDNRIVVAIRPTPDEETVECQQDITSKRAKLLLEPEPSLISPERAYQLNDHDRLNVYRQAIETAVLEKQRGNDQGVSVLDVSDFSLGAFLAAQLGGVRQVVSLENSAGRLAVTAARVAQAGQNAIPGGPGLEILQCHNDTLTRDVLGGAPVDIVIAEPYYEVLEGWHLLEALNFYFTVRHFRSKGILTDATVVVPSLCRVLGCAIASQQLRSAYSACGDADGCIRGLNHSYVNQLGGGFHTYDLALPMWQYDYTVLSEPFELGMLAYRDPVAPAALETLVRIPLRTTGRYDAVLVWVEHACSVHDGATNYISTNNRSHRQLVRMLRSAVVISEDTINRAVLVCKSRFGGVDGVDVYSFDFEIVL